MKEKVKISKPIDLFKVFWMIILCAIAVIYLYPLVWMADSSFRPPVEIFNVPPKLFQGAPWITMKTYSLHSFMLAFGRWNVGLSFFMSVAVTSSAILLTLLICSLCAYSFAYLNFPGKNAIFIFILASMMLPTLTMIAPYYKVIRTLGLSNTLWGLVIPYSASAFGVFLLRQYFIKIPMAFIEAAKIDGATTLQIWWNVTIPMAKPALAALAIYQFRAVWNDFLIPMIILRDDHLFTLPIRIQFMESQNLNKPYDVILCTGFMAALVPIIFFLIFQKQFIEGLAGGVKQ